MTIRHFFCLMVYHSYEIRHQAFYFARGDCAGCGGRDKQFRRGSYALFGRGDFRNFQRAVCFFRGFSGSFARNVDLYFSGAARSFADDYAEKVCAAVSFQLCGWICFRRAAGRPRALDQDSSSRAWIQNYLFYRELRCHLLWNRAFKPLPSSDYSDRPVSAGAFRHHKGKLRKNQNRL